MLLPLFRLWGDLSYRLFYDFFSITELNTFIILLCRKQNKRRSPNENGEKLTPRIFTTTDFEF
jgi:hypothetical protein